MTHQSSVATMTTPERCEAILKKVLELANTGKAVRFSEDFGDNTLTIQVGSGHTHVGCPSTDLEPEWGSWCVLVQELYDVLHGGPGLSWYDPVADGRPVVEGGSKA